MQTKRDAMSIIEIKKDLNANRGIAMIEKMLEKFKEELPEGKTINDFGGGYVEMLKTKAKVVLYFGFDAHKNRVSIKFQVKQDEIILWCEAIAEKIWNKEDKETVVEFDVDHDDILG
jgi:hypothetical protein